MKKVFLLILAVLGILAGGAHAEEGFFDKVEKLRIDVDRLQRENALLRQFIETGLYSRHVLAQAACTGLVGKGSGWIRAAYRHGNLPQTGSPNDASTWTGATDDNRMTCAELCAKVIDHPKAHQEKGSVGSFQCVNSLHVYSTGDQDPVPMHDVTDRLRLSYPEQGEVPGSGGGEVLGLKIHVYQGCDQRFIGPNYCCCIAGNPG